MMEKARAAANRDSQAVVRSAELHAEMVGEDSACVTASITHEMLSPSMSDDDVEVDPVAAKAREYADADERQLSIFSADQEAQCKAEIDATIYSEDHKALVYIECPTTAMVWIRRAIDVANRLAPPGSAMLIPLGPRTKIMDDVVDTLCANMNRGEPYWWTGSPGFLSKRVRPVCGVFAPHADAALNKVNTHVELKKVNAAPYEKLRLHSHSKACPWRCTPGVNPFATNGNLEIPTEDLPNMDTEDVGDEGEEGDVDQEAEEIAEGMSELVRGVTTGQHTHKTQCGCSHPPIVRSGMQP